MSEHEPMSTPKMIAVVAVIVLVIIAAVYYGGKGSTSDLDKAANAPAQNAGMVSETDRAAIEQARMNANPQAPTEENNVNPEYEAAANAKAQ